VAGNAGRGRGALHDALQQGGSSFVVESVNKTSFMLTDGALYIAA
jgi:hypothetical protein